MPRKAGRILFDTLFGASALLSLLLCAACVAGGAAGCREDADTLWWPGRHHAVQFYGLPGGVVGVSSARGWPDPGWGDDPHWRIESRRTTTRHWLVAEYTQGDMTARHADGTTVVVATNEVRTAVPWAVLLTGLLPAGWLTARVARRLRGRWAGRGYDVLPAAADDEDVPGSEAADLYAGSPPPPPAACP